MNNWITHKHYIEKGDWRVSPVRVRIGTKEILRFRAWMRNSGKWTPIDTTFESAKAAVDAIGEMK